MSATGQQEAIASYVTDMLALEEHIHKALAGQIADLTTESTLVEALRTAHRTCESHIEALSALAKRREIGAQGISEVVKRAAAGVLGIGAAAVDFVRGEKVAKNLRDDYAALSLAVIGYVMLYTVGMSLGDHEVATLAQQHLERHAKCVMHFQQIVPIAVVQQLIEDGLPARIEVLAEVGENVRSAWG